MAETRRRKYSEGAATAIDLNLRYQLGENAASFTYDIAREMVQEVSQRCSVDGLIEKVRAAKDDEARELLSKFGAGFMSVVADLADGKYVDRTGQLVKKVAERTGIWFPDSFRRYVEMAALCLRPVDRCNVVRATSKEYVFQQYSCSVLQKLKAGNEARSVPCESLCLSCFGAAAKAVGHPVNVELSKQLPKDEMCEFRFTPGEK